MNGYYLREPTEDDIAHVALNMREADKDEVLIGYGLEPLAALQLSVAMSKPAFTVVYDGEPLCIFGATRSQTDTQGVWMLASNALSVKKHSIPVARWASHLMDVLHKLTGCAKLCNYVWSENVAHLRWLRFAGCEISDETYPMGNGRFNFFTRYKEV